MVVVLMVVQVTDTKVRANDLDSYYSRDHCFVALCSANRRASSACRLCFWDGPARRASVISMLFCCLHSQSSMYSQFLGASTT